MEKSVVKPSMGFVQGSTLDPLQDGISSVTLVRVSGSDLDIVNAARVSFGRVVTTMSERDKKLVRYLLMNDHTSPFEHNQLSFRVKLPIFVARQWMRHRISSYNEISYRYVKSALEFYAPSEWRYQDKSDRQASSGNFKNETLLTEYNSALQEYVRVYELLLEQGVAREIARGVLPVCVYTEFIYPCNLLSFMHFLRLRMGSHAQYEIQCYARAMLELAAPDFPVALGAWKEKFGVKSDLV